MAIYAHLADFAGKPVVDWEPDAQQDSAAVVYRVRINYEEADAGQTWPDKFGHFLQSVETKPVTAFVAGAWDPAFGSSSQASDVIQALASARASLPNLRALFLGDIVMEESEISWIEQSDVSPLLDAYPHLNSFWARGGSGLSFGPALEHKRLETLVIQSGGLPASVIHELCAAHLPALRHLELWLGVENYGGDATVEDLAPILYDNLFPKLRYLGLRNSEIADPIAAAIVQAPILEHIDVLDLSMGTLGDEGAEALAASPALIGLDFLDIHHHYCSDRAVMRLMARGIDVDTSDPQAAEDDDWRYTEVSE